MSHAMSLAILGKALVFREKQPKPISGLLSNRNFSIYYFRLSENHPLKFSLKIVYQFVFDEKFNFL